MLTIYIVLTFVISTAASFYSASVGGGALITVPWLIFLGVPSPVAVATNVTSVTLTAPVSLLVFHRARKIVYRLALPLSLCATLGTLIGSLVLLQLPERLLTWVLTIALVGIVGVVLKQRQLGLERREVSLVRKLLGFALFIPLGIYVAIINAGSAILTNYFLLAFFGLTFTESAGMRPVIWFPALIVSSIIYVSQGIVEWTYGIPLLLGHLVGGYLGSTYAVKSKESHIKALFVAVSALSIGLLIFRQLTE